MNISPDIDPTDPLALLQALLSFPSVTPDTAGTIDFLESLLAARGFDCHRLRFTGADGDSVDNLYARWGTRGPNLCFAGHTDVVPPGPEAAWNTPPFAGTIVGDMIHGRGAADMKGPLACFIAAILRVLRDAPPAGSLSLLITGDEEGPALHGTDRVVSWLDERGETIDFCIVGEPTSAETLGDMVKPGRRGSLGGTLTVTGRQGHVAYPQRAENPVPKLLRLLSALQAIMPLDQGSARFDPSNLEIVGLETGTMTENVIPASATALFNIRFNDLHTSDSLIRTIQNALAAARPAVSASDYTLTFRASGESFYTEPGGDADLLAKAIKRVTGHAPVFSTSGGTSDARFIRRIAPVVEFGLVGRTAHHINEGVSVHDIFRLCDIYIEFIHLWFARPKS